MTCPNCGSTQDQHAVPVWEDEARAESGERPKFIGCTNCHRMHRPDLLRGPDDELPPQAALTESERDRLAARNRVGNQHSDRLSIIEWQCVKGAALYYGVRDWMQQADSTLTAEENVSLMQQAGYQHKTTTLREEASPGEYKQRGGSE